MTLVVAKSTVTALFVVPVRATVMVSVPALSVLVAVALRVKTAESFVRMVTTTLLVPSEVLVALERRTLKT